jgi:hypothetical protein
VTARGRGGLTLVIAPDVPGDEPDELPRMRALVTVHPDATFSRVDGHPTVYVPLENGGITVTRETWREVMDKLGEYGELLGGEGP